MKRFETELPHWELIEEDTFWIALANIGIDVKTWDRRWQEVLESYVRDPFQEARRRANSGLYAWSFRTVDEQGWGQGIAIYFKPIRKKLLLVHIGFVDPPGAQSRSSQE